MPIKRTTKKKKEKSRSPEDFFSFIIYTFSPLLVCCYMSIRELQRGKGKRSKKGRQGERAETSKVKESNLSLHICIFLNLIVMSGFIISGFFVLNLIIPRPSSSLFLPLTLSF